MGRGGEKAKAATGHGSSKLISLEEVAQHRVPTDAWVHMKGKVYDVSEWNDHPGEYLHASIKRYNQHVVC